MNNILSFIGLMKKASALAIGADSVYTYTERGKLRLIVMSADAAENTLSSIRNTAQDSQVPLIYLTASKSELGQALGQNECAVFGITDTGFALALCEKLGDTQYTEQLTQRMRREKCRAEKKTAAPAARKRRK